MHIYQSEVMICLITFWHLLVHLLIEQEFCLLCFRWVGPSIWVLHKHHPFFDNGSGSGFKKSRIFIPFQKEWFFFVVFCLCFIHVIDMWAFFNFQPEPSPTTGSLFKPRPVHVSSSSYTGRAFHQNTFTEHNSSEFEFRPPASNIVFFHLSALCNAYYGRCCS